MWATPPEIVIILDVTSALPVIRTESLRDLLLIGFRRILDAVQLKHAVLPR